MTPKQRLLAALRGRPVDRVPWSPFLAYFWEAQPPAVRERGQVAFLEEIGADPLLRGSVRLFSVKHQRCEIQTVERGSEKFTYYRTPVGELTARHVYSPAGDTWFIMDHPVKTEADFQVLTYINEDMVVEPAFAEYLAEAEALGERGLHIPIIGTESKTSFQSLLEYWVGTEELVYALMDYPKAVEECLAAMRMNSQKSVEISVESPAEGFIFWEDSSTTNISPAMFERYTAPEIDGWGHAIHDAGKLLIHHACGHLRNLLPAMGRTAIDAIESIPPPPTGDVELWAAQAAVPDHIGLIGGIEPTVFLNSTLDELDGYVRKLLQQVATPRFVLANSDSCPPGVSEEKFRLVTAIVNEAGAGAY